MGRVVSCQVLSICSLPCPCIKHRTLLPPASRPVHARALHSHANPSRGSLLPWGSPPSGFGPSRRSNSDPSGGGLGPPAPVCGARFGIGAMSWAGPDEILLSTSLAGFLDSELLRSSACDVPELAWLLILVLVTEAMRLDLIFIGFVDPMGLVSVLYSPQF